MSLHCCYLYLGLDTCILWRCAEWPQLCTYFHEESFSGVLRRVLLSVPSPFRWQDHCTSCYLSVFIFVITASFLPEFLSQRVSLWRAWPATMTTTHRWPVHGGSIQRLMPSLVWFFTKGIILQCKYLKCVVLDKSPKGNWLQLGNPRDQQSGFQKTWPPFWHWVKVKVVPASEASSRKGGINRVC